MKRRKLTPLDDIQGVMKKYEPTHTPTPWIMKHGKQLWGSPFFVGESVDGKHTPFQAVKKENAAYIVRAVNSHQELIEQIEEAMRLLFIAQRDLPKNSGWQKSVNRLCLRRQSRITAQAEGK